MSKTTTYAQNLATLTSTLLIAAAACSPETGQPAAREEATGKAEQRMFPGGGGSLYNGSLNWLICDIKLPLAPTNTCGDPPNGNCGEGTITTSNYKAILNGFQDKLQCNAIRIYIDPNLTNANNYPSIYTTVVNYARSPLGLAIYSSPLGSGMHTTQSCCGTDAAYENWIVNYDGVFDERFLSVFNEPGIGNGLTVSRAESILGVVRNRGHNGVTLVGLDEEHLYMDSTDSVPTFTNNPSLLGYLDIVSSHNAASDHSSTHTNWGDLITAAQGLRTWSSENPRPWECLWDGTPAANCSPSGTLEIGLETAFWAGADGIVLYHAPTTMIDAHGCRTQEGAAIANPYLLVNPPPPGYQWDNALNGWGTTPCQY